MTVKETYSTCLFIRGIPEQTKRDYLAWCARLGLKPTEVVRQFIRAAAAGKFEDWHIPTEDGQE